MRDAEPATLGPCPLCERPLIAGHSVNQHHLVPSTFGGREAHWIHKICHAKIHATLSERELLKVYHTWDALRAHPEIAAFIRWVERKPPEFKAMTRKTRARRR